jgi:hypothetical protein
VRDTARVRLTAVLITVLAVATAIALAILRGDGGDGRDTSTDRLPETTTTVTAAARRPSRPALCRRLDETVTGRVADASLGELSGLVQSRTRPGVLYAHEDSGAAPQLWALRPDGSTAGSWAVPGAEAIDWEDIATGPAAGGGAVVYLGDIGDNRAVRPYVDVYRVPEPDAAASSTAPAERMRLRYPDGARDAETLLADPRRGTLVIVSKELGGGRAYSVPAFVPGEATLRRGPSVDASFATAGDVSADGRIIAVRGYTSLAVWRRQGNESLTSALRRTPCTPPTALFEGQGEALALTRDGTTARTVNEASPAVLRRYRRVR